MEAEASRAVLDAQSARAAARKVVQQAEISRTAAQRDLERYERAYEGGAVSQNELATAQDQLKKAEIELASAKQDFALQGEGAGLDARNKRLLADRQKAVVAEQRRQVDALTIRAPFNGQVGQVHVPQGRSEEHTSELRSLMRISYAVFCLKKKTKKKQIKINNKRIQQTNIYTSIRTKTIKK